MSPFMWVGGAALLTGGGVLPCGYPAGAPLACCVNRAFAT
jgi:hypothetical protein